MTAEQKADARVGLAELTASLLMEGVADPAREKMAVGLAVVLLACAADDASRELRRIADAMERRHA